MFSILLFLLVVVSVNAQKTFDWSSVITNYDYRCTKTIEGRLSSSYMFIKHFNPELKCNGLYIEHAVNAIDKITYANRDNREKGPSKDAEKFLIQCVKENYGYLEINGLELILVGESRLAIKKKDSSLVSIDVDTEPDELFDLFVSNETFNRLNKLDRGLPFPQRKNYCNESNIYRRVKYYITHCHPYSHRVKSSSACEDQMRITWLCMHHLTYVHLKFEPPTRDLILLLKDKSLYVQEQKPDGEFDKFTLLYTI